MGRYTLVLGSSLLLVATCILYLSLFGQATMVSFRYVAATLGLSIASHASIDLGWYSPNATWINNLSDVINGTGTHGFQFGGSQLADGVPYGTYNWCNMPHVRKQEYPMPGNGYVLKYVEVVCRKF